MPSVQIVWGQLTKDSTNNIVWCIRLNLNMIFRIEVVDDQSLEKRVPQFDKH